MNKITGFSVLTIGEGKRVTVNYSVLDDAGNIRDTNLRANYVALDDTVLAAIAAIEHFEVIYKGARVNPLNWMDSDFTVKDAAVGAHLGSYTSVERPKPDKPAAQMQRIRVTCGDPEDGAQIGRLMATLQVPLEATVSNGDALSIMRVAQTLGAEYKAEYVG